MNAGINVGDIFFQLFALGVPIFFIAILLLYWAFFKKEKRTIKPH